MIEVDCWRTSSWRQNFEPCFFSGKHGLFLLVVFFFGDVLPQGTDGLTHYMEEGESLEA